MKKSELASKTSTGDWKVETTSAADAHDRTCVLAGGNDSSKGLHQLLWLAQTEFRLPDAKKFDAKPKHFVALNSDVPEVLPGENGADPTKAAR